MSKTTRKLLGDYLIEIRPASKKKWEVEITNLPEMEFP